MSMTRFLRDRGGAAAAEFAILLPGMLFLIFGVLNLCFLVYAAVNLHSAVEGAARYAVVQTNAGAGGTLNSSCTTAGSVCYYVYNHYAGPAIHLTVACSPSDCSASGCGHTVTGTGSYSVNYGLGAVTVPLSATACFS